MTTHERGILPLDELPVARDATLDDVAFNVEKLLASMARKIPVSTYVDEFVLGRGTLDSTLRQAFVAVFFSEQTIDDKLAALDELLAAGARGDANMRVSFTRTLSATSKEVFSASFRLHLQREMWSNPDVWPAAKFEPRLQRFFS